jgi:hypothetical protein
MANDREGPGIFDEGWEPPPEKVELEPDPQPKPRRGRPPGVKDSRPRAPRTTPSRAAKRTVAAVQRDPIGGVLLATFVLVGKGWKAADDVCGSAFLESAPDIARELGNMAAADDKVYDFLNTLTMGGGLAVILATLPVAVTVVNHHVKPRWQKRREDAAENATPGPEMEGDSEPSVA